MGKRTVNLMFDFCFASLFFCLSVMTHIFYCRRKPQSKLHAKAFCLIAGFYLGIYALISSIFHFIPIFDASSIWGLSFQFTSAVIFLLLIPIYLCFYVLTQLTSPSKRILTCLSQGGEQTRVNILSVLEKEKMIDSRLEDLLSTGCVQDKNGRIFLTGDGKKIAAILDVMQWALGREMGG